MKKIKSFEAACKALNISTTLPDVSALPQEMQAPTIAHYKLTIIAKAINNGWVPDWNNTRERKYYPWFYMGSGGAGFRLDDCDYDCDGSHVGSRLCYQSEEAAEYAGKQFADLYKEYFTIA